ncbi:MAG TPA: membrane protein insertase YidC, partial [Ferruginibacter sp.]|nr:membrane protein insertase YidC [Ferruginibacter sp.]
MDNIRFILVVTFAMLVFMLWQAWQLDYGPKPEVAAIVNTEGANAKEDLPITAGASAQTETTVQNPVSVPVAAASNAKTVKVKTDVIELEIDMQGGTITN